MDNTDQTSPLIEQLKTHYGLHANPFSPSSSVFYEDAQRMHNIETLRHLAIFGDMVLILTGEKCAGKTSLIERFSKLFGSEINIMEVTAHAGSSGPSSVVRLALLSHLQLIENEPARQTLSRLIQKYELDYQRHGKRTLFLVDDAEQLPKEELRLYFSIFRDQPPESGVVVLLVGLPSLVEYATSGSNIGREEWIHQIQLKPFSGSETVEYLQLRLQSAGYSDSLVLTSRQLNHLKEMGKGLPGRINRLFGSVVMESGSYKIEKRKPGNVSQRVLFSIAFTLLLSFIFVSYQHGLFGFGDSETASPVTPVKVDKLQEQVKAENDRRIRLLDEALKDSQRVSLSVDKALVSQRDTDVDGNSPNALEMIREPEALGSDNMARHLDTAGPESLGLGAPASSLVDVEIGQERKPESEPDMNNAQTPPPDASVMVDEAPIPPAQTVSPFFRSQSWVMKQAPSYYSAQVLGSYHEATALGFIENAGSARDKLFYLKTSYKGRLWYVVLYGQFSSKKEAREAIVSAPKGIRKEKPWLRSFQGILKTFPNKIRK